MISVREALSILDKNVKSLPPKRLPLSEALGCVVAEDVFSPIDMPPFRQSAMDGYAIRMHSNAEYTVIAEVQAGSADLYELKPGQAVRIFTGAAVPSTADCVQMQEKVTVLGNSVIRLDTNPVRGQNIRPQGEQIKESNLAVASGMVLTPAGLSYLQGLGIQEVTVIAKPSVAIITTGDELIAAGTSLQYGQIYESNDIALRTLLQSWGITQIANYKVEDSLHATVRVIKESIKKHDVIVTTGGISVGDHDYIFEALQILGTETHFYKVKQKPGKPIYYGQLDGKEILALPGNPASALTCFYIYGRVLLQKVMRYTTDSLLPLAFRKLSHNFTLNATRDVFLKAQCTSTHVSILGAQSSAMLSSYVSSNCLVYLPEGQHTLPSEESISCFLLHTTFYDNC